MRASSHVSHWTTRKNEKGVFVENSDFAFDPWHNGQRPKSLLFISLTIFDDKFVAFRIKKRVSMEPESMKQAFKTRNDDPDSVPDGPFEAN